MIETKLVEIRDEGTTIIALAIKIGPPFIRKQEQWDIQRAGYSLDRPTILLAALAGGTGQVTCDPYKWTYGRTMRQAHFWLKQHFDEIESCAVVDVEFLLGERSKPKDSDRFSEARR